MKEIKREIIDGNVSIVIDVDGKLVDVRIPPTQTETRVTKEAVLDDEGNILEPEQTETITRPTTREDIDLILEKTAEETRANMARDKMLEGLL